MILCINLILYFVVVGSGFASLPVPNNNNKSRHLNFSNLHTLLTVEKLKKYVDLKIEVSRLWRTKKVFVIPIIIGALGSVPTDLSNYLESLDMPFYLIAAFQRIVLFKTSSI